MEPFFLDKQLIFPDPSLADESGILAVGGDLDPERILLAYRMGIFPWYNEDDPLLWWSPDPRMVLYPKQIKVSSSMRRSFRKKIFSVTFDRDFFNVIRSCQQQPRVGQNGTWITEEMLNAYIKLHEMGHAHSVEVWKNDDLVGGLYGIALGSCFTGESMFSKVSNASKTALIMLTKILEIKGLKMVDCEVYTDHLASMGAQEISRKRFLGELSASLNDPPLSKNWQELEDLIPEF